MPDQDLIKKVAARLANNRANRRGAPDIVNVLDVLPEKLRDEVMQDAKDAFKIISDAIIAEEA